MEAWMKKSILTFALLTGLAAASPSVAQDAVKSNPKVYHVVLENDRVRVLHVSVPAGAKTTMHEHPDNVIIALSSAKVRFTGADGKSMDAALAADQAMWSPAEKHSGENVGGGAAEVILVELKGAKAAGATIPTSRENMKITPFFDNPRATAYRATTTPAFHEPAGTTHDYDQVVIALGPGSVSVNVEGKTKTEWKRGDVLFIGRGMKHETKNTSGKPLDFILVGIK
jgi:quercetin dioxygenase-like cupin family protein